MWMKHELNFRAYTYGLAICLVDSSRFSTFAVLVFSEVIWRVVVYINWWSRWNVCGLNHQLPHFTMAWWKLQQLREWPNYSTLEVVHMLLSVCNSVHWHLHNILNVLKFTVYLCIVVNACSIFSPIDSSKKNSNSNDSLLLLLNLGPKKLWFWYTGAFSWSTFTMLAPKWINSLLW